MGAFIAGCGMTRFCRSDETLISLTIEAASKALSSIEGRVRNPKALIVSAMNPQEITGDDNIATMLADGLGLTSIPAFRITTAAR